MLKALFIGGTGIISSGITKQLAENPDWQLTVLEPGQAVHGRFRKPLGSGLRISTTKKRYESLWETKVFDVVADFIAFTPEQVKRDLDYFQGRCGQYFFIGTGSAYQKPLMNPVISGKHSAEKSLLAVFPG